MKATVSAQEVQLVLESRIGKELSSSEDFSNSIADFLNTWTFQPDELSDYAKKLEDTIFQEIYTRLGRGMRYRSRNGQVIHIYSDDLPELADRCLALLLPRFSPSSRFSTQDSRPRCPTGSIPRCLTSAHRCWSATAGAHSSSLWRELQLCF